ncbi:csbd-like domain-containing [Trichoderma cornu-damae]|uniref:Csbd-like domain-containing n=1 Tax=Trichoderma cornu-damae TaxID=654480 RepID=A0A9P8TYX6_9HYPO|nr:csbd-like domain-containing [Trichoderma cornu-damae]
MENGDDNDDNNNNNGHTSNRQQEESGLMGAHAQYLKGAAEETIGSISGSQSWSASGAQDKATGLEAMKKAGEKRDAKQGYGRAEEWAGKLTGCEGMQKEGAASSGKRNE